MIALAPNWGGALTAIARQIWNRSAVVVVFIAAYAVSGWIYADEGSVAPEKPSPWLMVPLLTSNLKIDTSVGGLAGYLYQFDQKSTPSTPAWTAPNLVVGGQQSTSN